MTTNYKCIRTFPSRQLGKQFSKNDIIDQDTYDQLIGSERVYFVTNPPTDQQYKCIRVFATLGGHIYSRHDIIDQAAYKNLYMHERVYFVQLESAV
jgi:hypothetical protein